MSCIQFTIRYLPLGIIILKSQALLVNKITRVYCELWTILARKIGCNYCEVHTLNLKHTEYVSISPGWFIFYSVMSSYSFMALLFIIKWILAEGQKKNPTLVA